MVSIPEKTKSTEPSCIHHWLIVEAKGQVSEGRCWKCGKVKNFNNYIDKTGWFNGARNKGKSGRLAA